MRTTSEYKLLPAKKLETFWAAVYKQSIVLKATDVSAALKVLGKENLVTMYVELARSQKPLRSNQRLTSLTF